MQTQLSDISDRYWLIHMQDVRTIMPVVYWGISSLLTKCHWTNMSSLCALWPLLQFGEKIGYCEDTKRSVSPFRFFIITGVILLVTSTRLIARLPKPVQKFLKSNMERSHSIRRPGPARGKDPIQSTTIHASSLHILTSPGKEKA